MSRKATPHTCDARCHYILKAITATPAPSLQSLGDHFSITRERIRQLIALHGAHKNRAPDPRSHPWTCPTCHDTFPRKIPAAAHPLQHLHQRHPPQSWNAELDAMIVALHDAGYTNKAIIELLNIQHGNNVSQRLRRHGRTHGDSGSYDRSRYEYYRKRREAHATIQRLWDAGIDIHQLHRLTGMNLNSLYHIVAPNSPARRQEPEATPQPPNQRRETP